MNLKEILEFVSNRNLSVSFSPGENSKTYMALTVMDPVTGLSKSVPVSIEYVMKRASYDVESQICFQIGKCIGEIECISNARSLVSRKSSEY